MSPKLAMLSYRKLFRKDSEAAFSFATGVQLGFRGGWRWKKRRRESEVKKARLSLVSLKLHDPGSFVPRALTDVLNGAL